MNRKQFLALIPLVGMSSRIKPEPLGIMTAWETAHAGDVLKEIRRHALNNRLRRQWLRYERWVLNEKTGEMEFDCIV